MAATIADLRTLGYQVGIAHGSVQVEQNALDSAKEAAHPDTVAAQASRLTTDTIKTLDQVGKLPETPEERLSLATKIGEAALSMIVDAVSEKVAFHERALEAAMEMPDVWRVEQTVTADGAELVVASMMVACNPDGTGWADDDQAQLDSLADRDVYAERGWQGANADAMGFAEDLRRLGADVDRPELGADTFTVDGKTVTSADLEGLADKAQAAAGA